MTYLTRIDVTHLDFGWNPDQRVERIGAALTEQRANVRAATNAYNRDVATRNVADLEQVLERATGNEAIRQQNIRDREAQAAAKRKEHDDRALGEMTDTLRTNYLAQPGASEGGFQKALPRLLERSREDAVLNAGKVREDQLATARRRVGRI